jgi:hypothetical protein
MLPFFSDQPVFEPEATDAMTVAFVKVCQDLKLNGDAGVREAIAVRIIELAQLGERDPGRIRERVLREVRPDAAPGLGRNLRCERVRLHRMELGRKQCRIRTTDAAEKSYSFRAQKPKKSPGSRSSTI